MQTKAFLIDSHCHLNFPQFTNILADVVARAHSCNVLGMVNVSTRISEFKSVSYICETYENIWCSVGTHPHNASEEIDLPLEDILKYSQHPKLIAIGETGLDYHSPDNPPAEIQKNSFQKHIQAARNTKLPLIIHARDCDDDMISLLDEEMGRGEFSFVLHCFSSGKDLAYKAIELGGYISFSGILTFKSSVELRKITAEIPSDRILLETDAPYLIPRPCRVSYNEPALMKHTASVLGDVLGMTQEDVAFLTTHNFFCLFKKANDILSFSHG